MQIEIVQNEDGERVRDLVLNSGVRNVADLDWSNIFPFWLGIRRGGKLVGVIQVCIGLPIGRLELLAVDKALPPRLRAAVVHELLIQGCAALHGHGSEMASGMIPFEEKSYKRLLKKRGAVVILSGNTLALRLKNGRKHQVDDHSNRAA